MVLCRGLGAAFPDSHKGVEGSRKQLADFRPQLVPGVVRVEKHKHLFSQERRGKGEREGEEGGGGDSRLSGRGRGREEEF